MRRPPGIVDPRTGLRCRRLFGLGRLRCGPLVALQPVGGLGRIVPVGHLPTVDARYHCAGVREPGGAPPPLGTGSAPYRVTDHLGLPNGEWHNDARREVGVVDLALGRVAEAVVRLLDRAKRVVRGRAVGVLIGVVPQRQAAVLGGDLLDLRAGRVRAKRPTSENAALAG